MSVLGPWQSSTRALLPILRFMIDDDHDEFVMYVPEQDKSTGKPNQITIITNGEEDIGTKTKLKEEPQVPTGPAARAPGGDQAQVPTGPAARAPGGDQVLFEQDSQPNQLQLGAVSTGTILSMVTGPKQGVKEWEQAGLATSLLTPREHGCVR